MLLSPHTVKTRPELLQQLLSVMMASPISLHTTAVHFNAALRHDVTEALSTVPSSLPVLVTVGADDYVLLDTGSKAVKTAIPHAHFVLWKDVGHLTMLEALDQLVETLDEAMTKGEA
jgi:pimeloyl-ACP methyl ester carboxylesterase